MKVTNIIHVAILAIVWASLCMPVECLYRHAQEIQLVVFKSLKDTDTLCRCTSNAGRPVPLNKATLAAIILD
jgi:hypothetical protein